MRRHPRYARPTCPGSTRHRRGGRSVVPRPGRDTAAWSSRTGVPWIEMRHGSAATAEADRRAVTRRRPRQRRCVADEDRVPVPVRHAPHRPMHKPSNHGIELVARGSGRDCERELHATRGIIRSATTKWAAGLDGTATHSGRSVCCKADARRRQTRSSRHCHCRPCCRRCLRCRQRPRRHRTLGRYHRLTCRCRHCRPCHRCW